MAGDQPARRKVPPPQVLGMALLASGGLSGVLMTTMSQLLAARGVSELQIASMTGFATIPGTIRFLVAPALDVGLSRRTYATLLLMLLAAVTALALNRLDHLTLLPLLMFTGMACYYLYGPAVAGWFSQILRREDQPVLGAWSSAALGAGYGLLPALAIVLLRALPYETGVAVICAVGLLPLMLFAIVPHEPTAQLGFRDAFGPLWRDIAVIVRSRHVWRMMILLALPCATFSLTNTLSGIGTADFHASETFVGVVGGIGGTIGSVAGALVAPLFTRRAQPLLVYIVMGVVGALFTLALIALPRTPETFALAMIGENVFQGASFAVAFGAILLSMGENNPVAATQYALIEAAMIVPISYMPVLDGLGYARGGLAGNLATDAVLGLIGSAVMIVLFLGPWRDTLRAETIYAPAPVFEPEAV